MSTVVQNNYIGVDVSGTAAIPNGSHGVFVQNSDGNTIGGAFHPEGNLIGQHGQRGHHHQQ